jgi:HAD superfamily hydrolase (TIGR01484 family)
MIAGFNKLSIPYAFVTPDDIAVSEVNDDVHGAVTPIKEDYAIDPHFHHKHKITQLLAFYPAELDQAVADSGLLGDDMKAVRWNRIGVDVLKKDNSKARGIHDVLEALNIGIENAIAFGDGLNDIEMFNSVGFAVAMGNGEDELKVLADFVTKSVKEDGILYALEQLEII